MLRKAIGQVVYVFFAYFLFDNSCSGVRVG